MYYRVTVCGLPSRSESLLSEFHGQFDWRRLLREHRLRLRLSQPEVARRADLSLSAVKAYEGGDRHPSREALSAIIQALGLPVEEANRVFAGAGYSIDLRGVLNQRYEPKDVAWLEEQVEAYAWPVFATNQAGDVLAANRRFRLLIGIPLNERLPNPAKWNFVAKASDPAFADRLESWDASMRFMIGLAKAEQRHEINLERPAPFTNESFQRFLKGDPAYITRLLMLWEKAEPVPHTTRMTYPVRWRHESGTLLSFTATMHVADVWQELSWHDWIPDDAETLALLRTV